MKRLLLFFRAALLAIVGMAGTGAHAALSERVLLEELALPGRAGPAIVRVDAAGGVWTALAKRKALLLVEHKTGKQREYPLAADAFPVGILPSRDGGVYYTDVGRNAIGRLDPASGAVTEHILKRPGAWPFFLAETRDGKIWFTERYGNQIGRLDPRTGAIAEFAVPTKNAQPAGLVFDAHDRLFFTENAGKKIGMLDPATLAIREFAVPGPLKDPPYYGLSGIHVDASGDIWFAQLDGRIGHGVWDAGLAKLIIKDYPLPNPQARPGGIYADRAGRIWFTELDGNAVSYLKPDRSGFVRFPLLSGAEDSEPKAPPEATARGQAAATEAASMARTTRPFGIYGGRDGSIWFSQQYGSALGRLSLLGASAPAADDNPVRARWSRQVQLDAKPLAAPHTRRAIYLENGDRLSWSKSSSLHAGLAKALGSAARCKAQCESGPLPQGASGTADSVALRVRPFQGAVIEVSLPQAGRVPGVIDFDRHSGAYWYTEIGGFPLPRLGHLPPGETIARYDVGRQVRSFKTATPKSAPSSLKLDAAGVVWFTQQNAAKIGRFAPASGAMRDFDLPDPTSRPLGIAIDEKNDLVWFTDKKNSRIGHVHRSSGKVTLFATPKPNAEPSTIAVDAKGRVWFDQRANGTLTTFDAATGAFKEFALPVRGARVIGVTPDLRQADRIWFLELSGNALGRLDVATGKITRFVLPNDGCFPFKLHQDGDGTVWITEVFGNRIAAFHNGEFLEFDIATRNAMPGGISGDAGGTVTFTMQAADRIGHITPARPPRAQSLARH